MNMNEWMNEFDNKAKYSWALSVSLLKTRNKHTRRKKQEENKSNINTKRKTMENKQYSKNTIYTHTAILILNFSDSRHNEVIGG